MNADLDAVRIRQALADRGASFGFPLSLVDMTDSTNDDAKRAAQLGAPSGAAFVADAQRQGRGRLGRRWHSPPGENLYASFVVRPALDAKTAPLVTLAAGLAVVDALAERAGDRQLSLKWPNDVLLDGRKVAGILCEAQLADGAGGWIVVGIGINVCTTSFPDELVLRATSLLLAGATVLDRSSLFAAVAAALAARVQALRAGESAMIIRDVAARDALAGRAVTVDGVAATALGIAKSGGLRLRRSDGVEIICMAGDVQLRLGD